MVSGNQNLRALLKQEGTTYPKVVNLSSQSLTRRINATIRDTARQAIPDFDPGTPIITASSQYTTPLNQQSILSLRFEDYLYPEMAASGATGVSSVTLDLRTGEVYRFRDLFKPGSGYQVLLNQIIMQQITARQIPLLKPFTGIGPDESYYLTPDSLVIYYQPIVYTPAYFGVLEFQIPYSQIIPIIDPNGPIGRINGLLEGEE